MAGRRRGAGLPAADDLATWYFVLDLPRPQLSHGYLPREGIRPFTGGVLSVYGVLAIGGCRSRMSFTQDAAAVSPVGQFRSAGFLHRTGSSGPGFVHEVGVGATAGFRFNTRCWGRRGI